jgi:hypothetical protein
MSRLESQTESAKAFEQEALGDVQVFVFAEELFWRCNFSLPTVDLISMETESGFASDVELHQLNGLSSS